MPEIRNVSPLGDLDVPLLGRVVEAGQTVPVSDAHAGVLLQQTENWEPADKAAVSVVKTSAARPLASAPKDDWIAYATAQGDEDAASKTKKQLIDEHPEVSE